ncbi:O-antigen ligase [Myxosarcina sp. GI1]|uniref:O-antigen ligase family protein n=1 Tax=Myxosarcina sp. GI1 TaxID=1541065 RepID=UPI0005654678|nr:O-antigen ligase family protein [Myxosarcina sp. GI1]
MSKLLKFLENAFVSISLFFFSQAFFVLVFGQESESSPDKDSALLRFIGLLIYFVNFFLLVFRWQETFYAIKKNIWILLIVTLAIVSVSWSSVPDIAFRKIFALVGSTIFATYFGSHYSFDSQLKLMGWTYGISIILNYMFVFLLPEYGVMNTDAIVGAWQGIYLHKNGLGGNMFISFMTFYYLAQTAKKYKFVMQLCCLLSVILVYYSDSATSLLSVIIVFIIFQNFKYLSLKSKTGVLLILIFLLLAFGLLSIIAINFNAFLDANNRDITLSGRTILWGILWKFMREKFWFGYGYGSFFSASHQETELLWQVQDWGPVHAHNGYIQLWLNIGFVGCFIFVVGYFKNIGKALFNYLISKDLRMLWIFSFFSYTVFFNFTEVSFLTINSINWIISMAFIYSLNLTKVNTKFNE